MGHWKKSVVSSFFLIIMLTFAFRQTLAPEAATDSNVDYAALSQHVAVIAEKPHPMGSAANRDVRDYIVAYFESLGLQTEVQKTTVVYRHPTRPAGATIIGNVENIIARLPGRSNHKAGNPNDLVIMGHYDSRPLTPGAGDDASGTASIMEAARIMAAAPPPFHDVVFLITDGEEMGLLGAQGFFRQHPAAKQVGLVLNFEARGSYGASFMFETSSNNAWLVDRLIESTPDLVASSLSYEIYRQMPNDTDMSISKGEGIPGLNFAFSAGLFDYHAMTDNAENLDSNTLAHQANNVLASAQYFANLENWESAEGDKTYFNLWHGTLVRYSQTMALVLGFAVLLLGVWLFATGKKAGAITWGSASGGILGVLIIFLATYSVFDNLMVYMRNADAGFTRLTSLGEWPFLAYFILTLGVTLWFAYRLKRGLGKLDIFVPALVLVTLIVLAGNTALPAIVLALFLIPLLLLVRSRFPQPDLWTAALCVWWLLTALILYLAPNASYLFVWPLGSVFLGILVHRSLKQVAGKGAQFVSALIFAFIPLLLLPPVYILAYLALGLGMSQVLMVICALSLLIIWPLVRSIGFVAEGKAGWLLLGAGLVMTLSIVFGRGFDTRHPRGEELFYAIDVDQQQGFWVSSDARDGSWLAEFLGEEASNENMTRIMPGYDQDVLVRDDGLPDFKAAVLTAKSDQLVNGKRKISLHLQSQDAAEYVNVLFPVDAGITMATVNGQPVAIPDSLSVVAGVKQAIPARDWWRWRWYGLPEDGAEIMMTLEANRPLSIRIVEVNYGMPDGAPGRPKNSMSKKYTWSDSMVVFQTVTLE